MSCRVFVRWERQAQRRVHPPRLPCQACGLWLRVAQRLQQVLHGGPLAVALQRVQPDLVEQIALRMAAANLHQPGQGHAQLLYRCRPVAQSPWAWASRPWAVGMQTCCHTVRSCASVRVAACVVML